MPGLDPGDCLDVSHAMECHFLAEYDLRGRRIVHCTLSIILRSDIVRLVERSKEAEMISMQSEK
jgi:hypothetical protein